MGYDVHITRKAEWSDDSGPAIPAAEWRQLVAEDPELVLTGFAEVATAEGETLRMTDPLLAEWRGHSLGQVVWFTYSNGCVEVKNPDPETLGKMSRLADRLKARVQGDEGEFYDAAGNAHMPTPSLRDRLGNWWRNRRFRPPPKPPLALPFKVGDRVKDPWGAVHIVVAIDPAANHGAGEIVIRRVSDGAESTFWGIAHGLSPLDP